MRRPSARASRAVRERRRDLRRVVGVVVEHANAAALADELEPPAHAGEPDDRALGIGARRRPRARAPRAPRPRSGGCARPARRARASTARAPSRARRAGRAVEPVVEERARARPPTRTSRGGRARCSSRRRSPGRRSAIERSDSSPSTTSQPVARARVAAELRDDAADDPGRVAAELAQDERDHRRRRRLAVRAADDDRPAQRDELGEELRPRDVPRPGRVCAVETTTSKPAGGAGLATDVDVDARRAPRGRSCRARPSRGPRRPRRARSSRTRRARRRRSRRSRAAGRRVAESRQRASASARRDRAPSAIDVSARVAARASARMASRMRARRSGSASSSSTSAGTRASSLWRRRSRHRRARSGAR